MGVDLGTSLRLYKRPEVQQAIVDSAIDKEVAVKYGESGFGKRPDVLLNPLDVVELAKQKATSFHCSEELWTNPIKIDTLSKNDNLRKGWDLVIDIDCPFLEYSQIAGDLIVKALEHHGIKSISVKFSGNHGFHIAVPFEAFPEKVHNVETKQLFPENHSGYSKFLTNVSFLSKI